MAKFVLEIYELHKSDYVVEANSKEEAIQKYNDGEADPVDDSTEYIEVADLYRGDSCPDGIRSIEEE